MKLLLLLLLSSCLFKDTISSCVKDVDCLSTQQGLSYEGTETKTESGRTCQQWSAQSPHEHNIGTNLDGNFCRNPDGDSKPWCYTTDPAKRWEFCTIELCDACSQGNSCIVNDDCLASKDGLAYQGTLNKTVSGRTCQAWKSQTPHAHSIGQDLDGNYCRNPDGDSTVWCYTTDPGKSWEFCHVGLCSECNNGVSSACRCGLVKRRQRIVGGQETEVNEYPWMVSLLRSGSHRCGGSLINNRWILSAAHCFQGFANNPQLWQAALGEHDRTVDTEADHVEVDISQIVNHPDYEASTVNFDFSLLFMREEIDFSIHPHIRPICLPLDDDSTYHNMIATTTGWGDLEHDAEQSPDKLQEVDVNVLSNAECVNNYGYTSDRITEQMLCANVVGGGKDSCQGDSGGPLIVQVPGKDNYELIGITSWGLGGCAHPNYPGVYARVSKQLNWIHEKMGNTFKTCPR